MRTYWGAISLSLLFLISFEYNYGGRYIYRDREERVDMLLNLILFNDSYILK
jgi:hypothetical protein